MNDAGAADQANTPQPGSRLPDVGLSIFAIMSQKAAAAGALNLAQGFPDFPPPQALQQALKKHLDAGHHQYSPLAGVPRLREQIAAKTALCYGVQIDPETEVTVTTGATEALFSTITAMVRPGDEVILLDPAYDSYAPAVRLAGGKTVHVPLLPPHYRPDWDQVAAAVNDKTRLIMLNTPHNPCGSLLTDDDFARLQQIVAGSNVFLISDEVYEHIVFDQQRHISMLQYPKLRARAFVMSSFGKTYHATGWKVGYCVAPPDLTWELRRIHQFVTFCVSTPMQHAIADALDDPAHYQELPAFYQAKRDAFRVAVEPSRFKLLPCQGSYFQLLDYSAISDENDVDFANRLISEYGIASIPVSVFYQQPTDHKVLRFCFAKDADTLARGGDILCRI
ncbi:MAG: pyridoxal phosphate-dependent aminotransferase [Wenzhouxiangellaceae bacterium]